MTERKWYFALNNQQNGPVPQQDLQQMLAEHKLPPETLVWSSGLTGWLPASSVSALSLTVNLVSSNRAPVPGPGPAAGTTMTPEVRPDNSGYAPDSMGATPQGNRYDPSAQISANTQPDQRASESYATNLREVIQQNRPTEPAASETPTPVRWGNLTGASTPAGGQQSVSSKPYYLRRQDNETDVQAAPAELHYVQYGAPVQTSSDFNGQEDVLLRPRPWQRYFARLIDQIVYMIAAIIVGFVVGVVMGIVARMAGVPFDKTMVQLAQLIGGIVGLIVAFLIEAVLLGTWGSSIGKSIFGIRLIDSKTGQTLSISKAFERTWWVFIYVGIILAWIPMLGGLVCFVGMLCQYSALTATGITNYDRRCGIRYEHTRNT